MSTFCYNIARGIPIEINDKNASVRLVHVNDVIKEFLMTLNIFNSFDSIIESNFTRKVTPEYTVTLGSLAHLIQKFKKEEGVHEEGIVKPLKDTFLTYLPQK